MKKLLLTLTLFLSAFLLSPQPASAVAVFNDTIGALNLSLGGCALADSGSGDATRVAVESDKLSLERFITIPECSPNHPNYEQLRGRVRQAQGFDSIEYGAMGTMAYALSSVYDSPPASAGYYVADILNNAGLVSPAYAQAPGLGFASLTPILPIWKAFRNVAYFLFVGIFMITGFAIMFRAKLNPQTVISIQSALPKLIITLLLVTFSYAIAGLMIDLMYVFIFLIIRLFEGIFGGSSLGLFGTGLGIASVTDIALNFDVFQNIAGLMVLGPAQSISKLVGITFIDLLLSPSGLNFGDAPGILEDIIGWLLSFNPIVTLIVLVMVVISMFRLFFALLTTYITIILMVILSPLQIMLNALPGNNSFSSWLKNLFANIAVFPATITVLLLIYALTGSGGNDIGYGGGTGGFLPPLLPGRGQADAFQAILGIGGIMLLPQVPKKVKEAITGGQQGGGGGIGGIFAGVSIPGAGLATAPAKFLGGVGTSAASHALSGIGSSYLTDKYNTYKANRRTKSQAIDFDAADKAAPPSSKYKNIISSSTIPSARPGPADDRGETPKGGLKS